MKRFEILQARRNHVIEYKSIAKNAETRELTPEEQAKLDDLQSKIDSLDARLAALEQADANDPPAGEGEMNSARGIYVSGDDLPDTDGKHKYSLMKVLRALGGMAKLDGIEAECHAELSKRGQATKGILVPTRFATHRAEARGARGRRELRDLTATTGTGSIAAILGTDFIDLLRNKMLTQSLGARVLSGMTGGTFSLPKLTAAATAYWVAEGVAPTSSNQTIGQVTFTPKTLGAFTDLSRKFLLQTSIDAEAFVKDDLASIIAIEMDRAALNGSGSGAEPTGIVSYSGVGSVALGTNGAAPTFGSLVDMESAVAVGNADIGNLAYVTTAAGRGKLKKTLKDSNTAGLMLWEENELNGYPAYATQQLPSNLTKGSSGAVCSAALFGDWSSLVFGLWGALDLIEDPYTKSNVGGLRVVALQDLDVQIRTAVSFCKIVDMLTT